MSASFILLILSAQSPIEIVAPPDPLSVAMNWQCATPLIKQRLSEGPIPLPRSQTPLMAAQIAARCARADVPRTHPPQTDPRIIQLEEGAYRISRHEFERGIEFCLNLRGKCNGMLKD